MISGIMILKILIKKEMHKQKNVRNFINWKNTLLVSNQYQTENMSKPNSVQGIHVGLSTIRK